MREGASNPNWKGGISAFRHVDEILALSDIAKNVLTNKLIDSCVVDELTQCWNWTAGVFKKGGRARLSLGYYSHLTARVSYVLFKKELTNGLCVCHDCDNVLCINPDHLWLGTNGDNSADMVAKSRQAFGDRNGSRTKPECLIRGDAHPARIDPTIRQGENNPRHKLSAEQVREIRRRYKPYKNSHNPSNQKELAKEFDVHVHTIYFIIKGDTWKSVE